MITCDRCSTQIPRVNDVWEIELSNGKVSAMTCHSCQQIFREGEREIDDALAEFRKSLRETWLSDWLKSTPTGERPRPAIRIVM